MTRTILLVLSAVLTLACVVGISSPASAQGLEPRLAQAQAIRAELDARARVLPRPAVVVREAMTTAPVSSFALLSEDLFERRLLRAERGVWYGLCPLGGTCPSPAPRLTRPAADPLPRRLALELALRTFLETDADVVAVSLPTPRSVVVVVGRAELAAEANLPALLAELRSEPLGKLSRKLRTRVDALTRKRTYLFLGFEPDPQGGLSWGGMPRWPQVGG